MPKNPEPHPITETKPDRPAAQSNVLRRATAPLPRNSLSIIHCQLSIPQRRWLLALKLLP
jgi:hypothetical protein